jgi:hypothetical protein
MIVADAAPIIAFVRLGRLALLQRIVEELVVPDAVYDDLVVKGYGKPGAAEVAESTWIRREAIRNLEATAVVRAVRACSPRPVWAYSRPSLMGQWAWSGRMASSSARGRACW